MKYMEYIIINIYYPLTHQTDFGIRMSSTSTSLIVEF